MSENKFIGKAKIKPKKNALFLPYQKAWIEDRSQIKLMEKGRQIGISWSSAYDLVRQQSLETARLDAWCSSRDDQQARLLLQDCAAFAKILNIAAQDLGEVIVDKDTDIRSYTLKFSNECKINSMSSNPDAQAGKRGTRLLDEFALHKDPKKLYDIALPGITWGGQLAGVSTHRGSKNFFNLIIRQIKENENPKKISLHTVTLQTALEQGFLFKLQSKLPPGDPRQEMDETDYFNHVRASCSSDEAFLQEFMCVPIDDNGCFIDPELMAGCEYDLKDDWEQEIHAIKNEIYIGIDIGRKADLTVIWICEKMGDRFYTRQIITMKNTTFSAQKKVIWPLIANSNVRRCCIDATGLGMQLSEEAKNDFGYKVEPITFSAKIKEEMAFKLKSKMESRDFKFPFDNVIRTDFMSVKKEITTSGNIRFSADRGPNGHSDRFWAAALCLIGASTDNYDAKVALGAKIHDKNLDDQKQNEWEKF